MENAEESREFVESDYVEPCRCPTEWGGDCTCPFSGDIY